MQLIDATGLFRKMRKSLGNKRNELSEDDIAAVTRIYGQFAEGEHSRIFANADFGYRKITVERPLRLNFQASAERIERLKEERAFARLADSGPLLAVLAAMPGDLFRSRDSFEAALKKAAGGAALKLDAPIRKAILSALSERDETAPPCRDAKGHPEPDTELRDTENVSLGEDVHEYLAREVLPYVPDAWISEAARDPQDGGLGKVGYEINFNRHFYKYTPPRPLEEIEADIRELETEIVRMLAEITGSGAAGGT